MADLGIIAKFARDLIESEYSSRSQLFANEIQRVQSQGLGNSGASFISHADSDEKIALLLKEEIERRLPGVKTFCSSDPTDLPPGSNWPREIQRPLQESKLLLFVATERGLIHDDLGQALTAIKIVVSSLVLDWSEGRTFSERAESIINLIDPAIASVRKIATELRPAILNDLGLVAAVEWAAEEFKARTGTKCRLSLPANPVTPHFLIFAVIQRLIQARFADLRD